MSQETERALQERMDKILDVNDKLRKELAETKDAKRELLKVLDEESVRHERIIIDLRKELAAAQEAKRELMHGCRIALERIVGLTGEHPHKQCICTRCTLSILIDKYKGVLQ